MTSPSLRVFRLLALTVSLLGGIQACGSSNCETMEEAERRFAIALEGGESRKIVDELQRYIRDCGKSHLLLGMLAQAQIDAGQKESAILSLEAALSLDPSFLQDSLVLARLYHESGETVLAISVLEKAIENRPPGPFAKPSRFDEVKTSTFRPVEIDVYLELAQLLMLIGDSSRAEAIAREGLLRNTGSQRLFEFHTSLLEELGKIEEVDTVLSAICAINGPNFSPKCSHAKR